MTNTEILTLECYYDSPWVKIKATFPQNERFEEFLRLDAPIRWTLSKLKTKEDEVRYYEWITNGQSDNEEYVCVDNITQVIERYVAQGFTAQQEEIDRFINGSNSAFHQDTSHEPVKYTLTLVRKEISTT
ncbi:MAG: hypothetical protein IKB33_10475 [Spirochaetaceae bacterium]|nr:hypothetical protein [Spirochaetaceae bacterium]